MALAAETLMVNDAMGWAVSGLKLPTSRVCATLSPHHILSTIAENPLTNMLSLNPGQKMAKFAKIRIGASSDHEKP